MMHSFQKSHLDQDKVQPTLFLPGWGFDGRILKLLTPAPFWTHPLDMLDPYSIEEDLLQLLAGQNTSKIRLIGWSMGAMLALGFAARYKDLVESLVLISFRAYWPPGDIEKFRNAFSLDPVLFLREFYRKCFLGDRRSYTIFRDMLEPVYLAEVEENFARLNHGLEYLATYRMVDPVPDIPITAIHGGQDIVAPPADMVVLPEADLEFIESAGHTPFLHQDCSLKQELKKHEIMLKFSRAAGTYDNYARIQAEVARRLDAQLPDSSGTPAIKAILEIGCGTGNFTSHLSARFPEANLTAVDFSPEMLTTARQKLASPMIDFVRAEAENYLQQSPGQSYDLVVSNGSLQWFSNLSKTFFNISRVLASRGLMHCSIFGPESLKELAEGLITLDFIEEPLAAQTFPGQEDLRQILQEYFPHSTVTEERIVKEYESALDLLLHIKKTGTGGWQQQGHQQLPFSRIKKLDEWFADTYGSCRVTYQVFYLQGSKSR